MPIQLTPQNEQALRRVATHTGLSEDELVNRAVSSFVSKEKVPPRRSLRDEMRAWRTLSLKSLHRFERRLPNN